MHIEKLSSGTYRVIKQHKGKRYSLTFNHKPTQKEIEEEFRLKLHKEDEDRETITFKEASKQYVDLKRNVLSPATVREYTRTSERLPVWFVDTPINKITQVEMQRVINELASTLTPKTVKDRYSFCVAVIRLFKPDVVFHTTLPQKVDKEPYIPTHDDVKRILDYSKGGRYEIVLQLACYGLRREEICALKVSDVTNKGLLTINKAMVQDEDKNWVIKTTKTPESIRTIAIDEELTKQIKSLKTEMVFEGYPQTIANYLRRTQDKLGMEHFSLHKLRHYFCSTLAENNVPESDILAMGGWKQSSNVMKEVYRHSNLQREKERMKNYANILKKARS